MLGELRVNLGNKPAKITSDFSGHLDGEVQSPSL